MAYIYIYIYIYCHPQTDCFVVSQLFSVVRHIGCFKLGLKPAQLYIRLSIIPLSHQLIYISSGIIRHYVVVFICLHFALSDTRVLNSYEELCIKSRNTPNSFISHSILTNHTFDFHNSTIFTFIYDRDKCRIIKACSIKKSCLDFCLD